MPNDVLLWIGTGLFTFILTLVGVVWSLLRSEAKEQAEQLKEKADAIRLHEVEGRFQIELQNVKEGSEKLISKLEQRHDKEMEQLSSRLSEQIRITESNIMSQLKLMIEVVRAGKE